MEFLGGTAERWFDAPMLEVAWLGFRIVELPMAAPDPGDADGDGDVDMDDFVILKQNYLASPLTDDRADFDFDGDVDLDDFILLKQNFTGPAGPG